MKRFAFFILGCIGINLLPAQSLFESANDSVSANDKHNEKALAVNINGFARGSVFGGGKTYDLATTFAEFALQTSFEKGKTLLKSDIRLRKGMSFNKNEQHLQFKELYAGYQGEKFGVMLGNQIINWGRTDGFNPTNNITPNDYFFLSADQDDQKLSNFMLRSKFRFTPDIELELIGVPFYEASNYRYELFDMGQNVTFGEAVYPDRKLKNGAIAGRLNFDLPAIGWSVSYFNGYDPYHGFDVLSVDWSTGKPMLTNVSRSYRKQTIGADFAVPVDNWIIRGEGAYNITKNPDNKMYTPASDFSYVAGVETNISGFTIIGQYIGKIISDFKELTVPVLTDPMNPMAQMQYAGAMIDYENRQFNRRIFNQQKGSNHGASLTLTKSFGYDAWNAEFTSFYNFTSKELLLRPKLTWKINDTLSAALGANYMKGDDKTLFNYSSKIMNGGFFELKATF